MLVVNCNVNSVSHCFAKIENMRFRHFTDPVLIWSHRKGVFPMHLDMKTLV